MPSLPIVCVLIQGFLMLGLMITMSLMRMKHVKGEGDPKSTFEKIHKTQLLTGEYVPILCALILFIHTQANLAKVAIDGITQLLMVGATFGRVSFALRHQVSGFDFLGATVTYISFAGLLIAAAVYAL